MTEVQSPSSAGGDGVGIGEGRTGNTGVVGVGDGIGVSVGAKPGIAGAPEVGLADEVVGVGVALAFADVAGLALALGVVVGVVLTFGVAVEVALAFGVVEDVGVESGALLGSVPTVPSTGVGDGVGLTAGGTYRFAIFVSLLSVYQNGRTVDVILGQVSAAASAFLVE